MEIATENNIAVCGPNCAGFINNVNNIHAFGLPLSAKQEKGNIGLVAQSGQVATLCSVSRILNSPMLFPVEQRRCWH